MVFRMPTHLEDFIPPPVQQFASSRPWRGTMITYGLETSPVNIRASGIETDGETQSNLWPLRLAVRLNHDRPILKDVHDWVRRHAPPLCTFMPDRLRDAGENTNNQAHFRSLSKELRENQLVAIASWDEISNPSRLPGAGIIIYPAQNSSQLLVGAIFLTSAFPSFVHASSPGPQSTTLVQSSHHAHQRPSSGSPNYDATRSAGPSARHPSAPSSYDRPHPSSVSPTEQVIKHPQYTHLHLPRVQTLGGYINSPSSSSTDPSWPSTGSSMDRAWPQVVKDEDDGDLSSFNSPIRATGRFTHY